jgi:hypothetical protein
MTNFAYTHPIRWSIAAGLIPGVWVGLLFADLRPAVPVTLASALLSYIIWREAVPAGAGPTDGKAPAAKR